VRHPKPPSHWSTSFEQRFGAGGDGDLKGERDEFTRLCLFGLTDLAARRDCSVTAIAALGGYAMARKLLDEANAEARTHVLPP